MLIGVSFISDKTRSFKRFNDGRYDSAQMKVGIISDKYIYSTSPLIKGNITTKGSYTLGPLSIICLSIMYITHMLSFWLQLVILWFFLRNMSRVPLRGMCRTIKDGKVARLKISDYELTPISNVRVEAKDLTPDFSLILKRMERTTTNKKKHWHRVHINAGRKWGIGLSLWALGICILFAASCSSQNMQKSEGINWHNLSGRD